MSNVAWELDWWRDGVSRLCEKFELAPPTGAEWDDLMLARHPGKSWYTSVDELENLRAAKSA